MKILAILTVALCLLSGSAQAQTTVNNPTAVTFTASADHNTIWTPAPGQPGTAGPVLTSYRLDIQENGTLVRSTDLGKPTPSATNTISAPLVMTGLQQNHTYMAVVVAIGPGGNTPSTPPAGPFGWFVATPILPPSGVTNVRILVAAVTSPNCADVPNNATQIIDTDGAVWTIGTDTKALKDGVQWYGGLVSEMLWAGGQLYVRGGPDPLNWYRVITTSPGYVAISSKPVCP